MRLILALCLGGLTTLGFAPWGWWVLVLLAPAILLLLVLDSEPRSAAALTWVFGLANFGSGLYWIYVSTHIYGGAPAWLAVLLILLLSAYLALFPAMAVYVVRRLLPAAQALAAILFLPLAWSASELLRGWLFSGFPWLSLGYALIDMPLAARWAPLLGVHGLTAMALLLAGGLALALRGQWRCGMLSVLVWLGISGVLPAPLQWTTPVADALPVALVQGNIPQDQKWLPQNRWTTMERYRELTQQAWHARLIVWPEVAVPTAYHRVRGYFLELDEAARRAGTTVLASAITRADGNSYNTVYAVGMDTGRYTKRHLVPFGEYFPVPAVMQPVLNWLDLPYGSISTDMPVEAPLRVGPWQMALSICFEDVFPDEVRRSARGAGFLVNVTNDAWFAGSTAPWQHLQIARMRSLETGRPMVRVANTGISALIDADGKIRVQTAWGETAVLQTVFKPREGQTPFVRWGHGPLFVLLFLGLLGGLLQRRWAAIV